MFSLLPIKVVQKPQNQLHLLEYILCSCEHDVFLELRFPAKQIRTEQVSIVFSGKSSFRECRDTERFEVA